VDPAHPHHVCKLHKAIYGLKEAPRAWFTHLSQALFDLGFHSSSVDTSLFIYYHSNVTLYLLVYVDDILLTGTDSAALHSIIAQFQSVFAMKDLGDLRFFLGMQAHHDSHGLHIRQSKYIINLLHKSSMAGAKPYAAPTVSSSKLSASAGDPLSESNTTTYRQVVGALQYCTITHHHHSPVHCILCQPVMPVHALSFLHPLGCCQTCAVLSQRQRGSRPSVSQRLPQP
jgi:hypothetical protein